MQRAMRILVVEDDPSTAGLLALWLTKAGFVVEVDHSAEEATNRLNSGQRWDLVVADIHLPLRSGLELVKRIHIRFPFLPFLLITAERNTEIASAALGSGALGFLLKPFDRVGLLDRVEEVRAWVKLRRRVLVTSAYASDPPTGCGGTILKYAAAGHQVMILPLIRTANHDTRAEGEAEAAAHALGAVLSCSPMWESGLITRARLARSIEDVVGEFQPDVVLAPTGADMQTVRRLVHEAAVYGARNVRNLLCYQSPTSSSAFCPTLFVDTEAEFSGKQNAMACFRGTPPQIANQSPAQWGHIPLSRSSEVFQVVRLESSARGEMPYLPGKRRAVPETIPAPVLELG